ncbi:hypothetical protein K469DRAFT_699358 [Zopfia rhizophila CBS 207.26]|uniref:Uncharacterized protein n=1 Tax=Zopfia rhizophila CBS 207.26 TaxID=1314779 RepID=A0A6A6F0U1_9PEZI|nr:hypothetical protein K469DRAFT_699358 [Zopfia rhizophila CBS 207.26]
MDEIIGFIEKDQSAKELISTGVASNLNQLSVVAICLRQLCSFQPWAPMIEYRMKLRQK